MQWLMLQQEEPRDYVIATGEGAAGGGERAGWSWWPYGGAVAGCMRVLACTMHACAARMREHSHARNPRRRMAQPAPP